MYDALREVAIVGGGLAGLSAAIYMGRAMRDVALIDAGHSMAVWEPDVQNYLGFPEGISGKALIERGRKQAASFGAAMIADEVLEAAGQRGDFRLTCRKGTVRAKRVLLATGIFHLPPDIPEVGACTGRSMFFCKDCDGYRVLGQVLAVFGANDEAVEYALGMLAYSPSVMIVTNGEEPRWSDAQAEWIGRYRIPVHTGRVETVEHEDGMIHALRFEGGRRIAIDCLFTTRGDFYHLSLARDLGVRVDVERQIIVDERLETTTPGVYAAGCVTPANCQMIIAAGQGATVAQAINRDLFEESLRTDSLRPLRLHQLREDRVLPEILE